MVGSRQDERDAGHGDDGRLEAHPRTLRDGRKRLVGFVDGYATYYDTRRHRIDVRLERFDGTYYITGYYQLQRHESVADYVRTVEAHGAECEALSRWVERQLRPDHQSAVGRLRLFLDRLERLVRVIR